MAKNISKNFVERVQYDLDRSQIPSALREALDERISHPTDTHPTTLSRIESLGLRLDDLLDEKMIDHRMSLRDTAIEYLDDVNPVEEQLTKLKHTFYAAMGVPIPEEQSDEDAIAAVMASILAHLVRADEIVDDNEIFAAEELAESFLPSFDRAHFRECCRLTTELPDLDELLRVADVALTETGREAFLDMLQVVAEADGTVHDAEAEILRRARTILEPGE